jgi:hypothetical protein
MHKGSSKEFKISLLIYSQHQLALVHIALSLFFKWALRAQAADVFGSDICRNTTKGIHEKTKGMGEKRPWQYTTRGGEHSASKWDNP